MTTERLETAKGGAVEPAAHLTIITGATARADLAAALDCRPDEIVDRSTLVAACDRLAASRVEGYEIIRQNITGEIALVSDARRKIDARIEMLSRRAEEIEAAIAQVDRGAAYADVSIDLGDLSAAVVAFDHARLDPDGPSADACALADEIDAATALRDHARRTTANPMVLAAEAELADARAALVEVRGSIESIDPALITAVNAAHRAVEERAAELESAKRSARVAARSALEQAAATERAALDACGFEAYATFAVQIAQGGTRPEDDAALSAAQRRVSEAEAIRRREVALAAVPDEAELDEDEQDRRERATALLGRTPGDDVAVELRALRQPGERLSVALDDLCDALRAIGVDPGVDPRAVAQRALDVPPTEAASGDVDELEAELVEVDDEGARLSDEYDRLGLRLDELSIQRANVSETPSIMLDAIDEDDIETLVRDLLDARGDLLALDGALDDLPVVALDRALAVLLAADAEIVIVSMHPVVAMWGRGIGAEVLDELPPIDDPSPRPVEVVDAVVEGSPDARSGDGRDAPTDDDAIERDAAFDRLVAALREASTDDQPEPDRDDVCATEMDEVGAAVEVDDPPTRVAPPVSVIEPPLTDDVLPRRTPTASPAEPPLMPAVASAPPAPPETLAPDWPVPAPLDSPAPMLAPTQPPSSAAPVVPAPQAMQPLTPAASTRPASNRDARGVARAERAERRAVRKREREAEMVRKIASRFDHYPGSIYHQPSEIPPWAHWDEAANARRGEREAMELATAEHARLGAEASAARVETRLGYGAERGALDVCVFHRNTETRIRCSRCTEAFCDQCLVPVGTKQELICVECAVKTAGVRERRRKG